MAATRTIAVVVLLLAQLVWAQDGGVVVVAPRLTSIVPVVDAPDGGTSSVAFQLTIDERGRVLAVEAESTTDPGLVALAEPVMRSLEFAPALMDGAPVPVAIRFVFHFAAARGELLLDAGERSLLKGQIFSRGTRDTVVSASLSADDGGVLVEADADGRFELWLSPGTHAIEVHAAAHLPASFTETLEPHRERVVEYRIVRDVLNPYQTIVRAQRDRTEAARVELSGAELREVAGTMGEPLRVIMLLPGVTTPASGLSYPIVRGALPAATGYFLDGVQIPQLYHLLLGPSVIHPEFIESVDFFPSNAPVRFGRISAGVVSASVAKPRDDRVHVTAHADLTNAGAFVEVPLPQSGTNIAVAGRFSYSGAIAALIAKTIIRDATPVADFYDYQLRVEQKLKGGTLRLLAFGNSDFVGARSTDESRRSEFLISSFHRGDLRWEHPLGPGSIEAGATVGTEEVGLKSELNGSTEGSFLLGRLTASGRVRYRIDRDRWTFKAGVDMEHQASNIAVDAQALPSPFLAPGTKGLFTGAYVEAGWFGDQLALVAGLRADHYLLMGITGAVGVDPRAELRFKASDTVRLHANVGLFHQAPMLLLNLPVTDVAALGDGLQSVLQFGMGVELKLPWGLQLTIDGYYNDLLAARERSLLQFISGRSTVDDQLDASRTGRAYGLEVMLRSPQQGRFFGWISYSLMRSERERVFGVYDIAQNQVSTSQGMIPFAFDETHVLNLVAGVQLPKGFKLSATLHFNSGRPESGEFSSRTERLATGSDGQPAWQFLPLNQVARLPAFFRVDARASKTWLFDKFSLELYLDVLNVSGSQEVYGFDYGYVMQDGNRVVALKSPIQIPLFFPTLGLKAVY